MATLKVGGLAFDDFSAGGLLRPAAEKFAGAWLACLLVMARGNIFAAFSVDHIAPRHGLRDRWRDGHRRPPAPDGPDEEQRRPPGNDRRGRYADRRCLRASVALSAAMGGAAGHGRGIRGHCGCAVVRKAVGGLRLLRSGPWRLSARAGTGKAHTRPPPHDVSQGLIATEVRRSGFRPIRSPLRRSSARSAGRSPVRPSIPSGSMSVQGRERPIHGGRAMSAHPNSLLAERRRV